MVLWMLGFYGRWASMTLQRPFGVADGIGVALGTLVPVMVRLFPASDSAVTELVWHIPIGIVTSIGLVRLTLAPYWIYQERDEKARQVEIGLEARITELQARVAFKLQRQALCSALTKYMMQGDILCQRCVHERASPEARAAADSWFGNTVGYLQGNLSSSYVARFRSMSDWDTSVLPRGFPESGRVVYHGIKCRVATLGELVRELGSS